MSTFVLDAIDVAARFAEGAVVFLTWELAWRDYGVRAALRAFAAVIALYLLSRFASLLLSPGDNAAAHYFINYVPLSGLIRLPPILVVSYVTGALTRKIFGAGRKYSLSLPTLAD
jgi:hypothetical protein